MWVQTPWGVFEVKNSIFMYNTIFVYILRVPVSMKGSKGHQKSRKQRKQTGFKELAHICVLCSAIASPSLLSSSPIRVNPTTLAGMRQANLLPCSGQSVMRLPYIMRQSEVKWTISRRRHKTQPHAGGVADMQDFDVL